MAPETIIAYQKDGEPLSEGLRLVLPGYNGASWIAQIVSITMSSKEAVTPPAASGPGARGNLIENIIENRQTLPTPTFTPQPKPNISTPNPTAPPANINQIEPTPKQQTADNQSTMFESGAIAIMAAVFAMGLVIAGIMIFKGRSKLKDSPPHNS